MKTFRDYLLEATRATQQADDEDPDRAKPTKDKDDWSSFDDLFSPKQDQPLANREPEPEQARDEPPAGNDDNRRRASQRDTLRATQNIAPTDRMRDLLGRMRDIEGDDDTEYPRPDDAENLPDVRVNNANLPAVAGQALRAAGVQDPEFHKVANLPGNMSRAIRTLGRQLFGSFTRTNTSDIWMVGNLNGQGPNSRQEVNAVAGWVRNNGEDIGAGDINFDTSIPGYQADIQQYSANGIRWLLVRDEFGDYIYSWPETDSIQANNAPQLGQDRPRLPNR